MPGNDLERRHLWLAAAVGALVVARMIADGKTLRKTRRELRELGEEALSEGARAAAETLRKDAQERADRQAAIGEGAHDPGAIVFYPEPDPDIEVERYRPQIAWDRRMGRHLGGPRWAGSYEYSPKTAGLYESKGNPELVALLHGNWSPGWRPDEGEAEAFTITHAHPDGYFPNRDALYADVLPLARIAKMIQAVHEFPYEERPRVPLVVIDNREAHRAERERLAALEDPNEIRGKNGAGTPADRAGAVVQMAEPDAAVRYDAETRTSFDPRTGLSLSTRDAGDRDRSYIEGTVSRGDTVVAVIALHQNHCWRPGFGATQMITLNRAWKSAHWSEPRTLLGEDALSLDSLAPLINADERLVWRPEWRRHAVIVDTRAEPIEGL